MGSWGASIFLFHFLGPVCVNTFVQSTLKADLNFLNAFPRETVGAPQVFKAFIWTHPAMQILKFKFDIKKIYIIAHDVLTLYVVYAENAPNELRGA